MPQSEHFIPDASALDVQWVNASGQEANCVDVAALAGGGVAVRQSKAPNGPALLYSPGEWSAFLAGAKEGVFDGLAAE